MRSEEIIARTAELTGQITALPKGYISEKRISGRVYYYHQWSEGGQKKSRYLHDDEIGPLSAQIEQRKKLQAELKALRSVSEEAQRQERNEAARMKCVLMHQRTAVADLEIDDATGFIQKVGTLYAPEHLPVGVVVRQGTPDRTSLNDWWTERSIPASRSGIQEALETLDLRSTKTLLLRCLGLSLSDQYWICPDNTALRWEDLNFFSNAFSEDIGDVLFGAGRKANGLDLSSPDNTSDGNLKKRWKIIDGERCLIKGGSNPFRQQPFNEVIAAGIMERLGIYHVPYSVTWNKGAPYSVCRDFITADTELVPAYRIIQTQKKSNSTSVYQHFVACAEALGIPGVVPFLDRMITLDYIIANEDRHLNNFGAVRNARTLEWLGMAPIYDSGSSLGYDKVAAEIRHSREITCKPFKRHHEEQLKLVTDLSWISFDRLSDVRDLIVTTLSDDGAKEYMDENRVWAIADSVDQRIRRLVTLSQSHASSGADSTADDVTENTAQDYVSAPSV